MLANIRHFILIAIVCYLSQNPLQAQIFDNFSDGNHTHNPSWKGDTGSFQVNPKFELFSNSTPGTSGQISIYLPQLIQDYPYEWGMDFSFSLNPSSQNFLRLFLYADSFPFHLAKNALYLNFGGSSGSSDSLSAFSLTNGTIQHLAAGRPGTLGKSTNKGKVYGLVDADSVLKIWLDTSNFASTEPELSFRLTSLPVNSLFGVSVKHSSSTGKSYGIDNIFARAWQADTIGPKLVHAKFIAPKSLRLSLDESPDSSSILLWAVENKLSCKSSSSGKELEFEFASNPPETSWYCLNLQGLQDGHGNAIQDKQVCLNTRIVYPGNLRISELMPDPEPSKGLATAEYIELVNLFSDTLQLEGMTLSDPGSRATLKAYKLAPCDYLLLVAEKDSVFYPQAMALPGFPSLNNSGDQISLANQLGNLVDHIHYSTSWFAQNPAPDGGISLSLIYPNRICLEEKAWGAAQEAEGGSPGRQNEKWDLSPEPPDIKLIRVNWIAQTELELEFNKPIQEGFVELEVGGNRIPINLKPDALKTLHTLAIEGPGYGTPFTLNLSAWQDCAGNKFDTSIQLVYYRIRGPQANELLIYEILYDPLTPETPEFIELYNASNDAFALRGVRLEKPGNVLVLPNFVIEPKAYLVLSKTRVDGLSNQLNHSDFFSLNQEDSLMLKDSTGAILHELFYTSAYFKDEFKRKQKGWSLELQNTNYTCSGEPVWRACSDNAKHTAGKKNSATLDFMDKQGPLLQSIYPIGANQIRFKFNEPVMVDSALIFLDEIPVTDLTHGTTRKQLIGTLPANSLDYQAKSIRVSQIRDYYENRSKNYSSQIALPKFNPDSTKLVINEVLFNPKQDGTDFIELYNSGEQWIDLQNFGIVRLTETGEEAELICTDGELIGPGQYKVLTFQSQQNHYLDIPELTEVFQNIPTLPDEGATLLLKIPNGKIADSCWVNKDMHFALLDDEEGVSLERINPAKSGMDPWNWHSASFLSGYATPGKENSMKPNSGESAKSMLTIQPEIISPNLDGFNDYCTIEFQLPESEMALNIHVLNWQGREIKTLCAADNAAQKGQILWDGLTNDNSSLPEGIYLVNLACFSKTGKLYSERKWVVIAQRDRR